MKNKLKNLAVILVTMWVVVSPFLWWNNTFKQINDQLPLLFIAHPAILAIVAIGAAPFLLRSNRRVANAIVVISLLVVCSLLFLASTFTGGVILNAGLLIMLAVLTSRSTGPARKDAQSG